MDNGAKLSVEENEKESFSEVYSLIKDEYEYCFNFLNLHKKDYFTIIGTIIAIFAIAGILVKTADTIYWIPISFLIILLFSIIIILYFVYIFYFQERKKIDDHDCVDELCLDLCFKNIRPIFYSVSLLLLINATCLILVICGITGISNVPDIFLNFYMPNVEYDKFILNLTAAQKTNLEHAIFNVEFLYVFFIIFLTLSLFAITYFIQKMQSPYSGSKYFLKTLRFIILGFQQKQFDQKQIFSSLYYLILKYTDNIFRFFLFGYIGVMGVIMIAIISYTIGLPEVISDSSIIVRGLLISVIQLIAFVLLLDFFENSQINTYYFDRLHVLGEMKSYLKLSQINKRGIPYDKEKMMTKFHLSNLFITTRMNFIILSIPAFSLNIPSIKDVDLIELKREYRCKNEKLMILTNRTTLFYNWSVAVGSGILIILTFIYSSILGILTLLIIIGITIGCGLTLRWIKKNLPPAFDTESSFD